MRTTRILEVRRIHLALAIASLSACTVRPDNPSNVPSPIERLTAGKTAGAPLKCLPSYVARDQLVLDSSTIAYRAGSGLAYVNHLAGCPPLDSHLTLLTHPVTGELCRGDTVTLLEPPSNLPIGSCSLGDFIPYSSTRR